MQAVRDRIFRQETLSEADLARTVEPMGQSRESPPGAADAPAIALAELLTIQENASTDGHRRAAHPRGVDFATLVAPARRPQSRESSPLEIGACTPQTLPRAAPEILCCTVRRYNMWCSTTIMAG